MPAGLYLHVPFCRHRCGYCDFPLIAGASGELVARYVAALRVDIARTAALGAPDGRPWPAFSSVFVGGGTPTLLDACDLAGILDLAREVLPVTEDAEISVEANPENVTVDYLSALADAGLGRVSIGAQSSSTRVLDFLERDHSPDLVPRAVDAARRAGIGSVNVDLIYGAPAESAADWHASLEAVLGAGVDHVSCYALTLEPNTPYASRVRRGEQAAPDDDVQAERMAVADEVLSSAGLVRYEVSNWARPGHASRHNAHYWRLGDYLGVGAGAHGHWSGTRWWSVRSPERYAKTVEQGGSPVTGREVLEAGERRMERLLLGLRTIEGVARADVEPLDEGAVGRLASAGLLADEEGRLRLTPSGLPVANAVTLEVAGPAAQDALD